MRIRQTEKGWEVLGATGQVLRECSTEELALAALEELQEALPVGGTATSAALEERPFLVDGVALDEAQLRSLANLVAGRSRRGPRAPLELPQAIDLWRRHNYVITEGEKKRWRVHSASPTFREGEEEQQAPLSFVTDFLESNETDRGRIWEVTIIREGWSLNGKYYHAQALEQAIPVLEGCPVAIYGWDPAQKRGHLPPPARAVNPEGFARNYVGWIEAVHGVRNESGRYELRGTFRCIEPALRAKLAEVEAAGRTDVLGLSIDAVGVCQPGGAEGRRGHIVRSIQHVHETTVVTNPAAGGRFLRLVAAQDDEKEVRAMDLRKLRKLLRDARLRKGKNVSGVDKLEGQPLLEAIGQEKEALQEMLGGKAALGLVLEWIQAGKTEDGRGRSPARTPHR